MLEFIVKGYPSIVPKLSDSAIPHGSQPEPAITSKSPRAMAVNSSERSRPQPRIAASAVVDRLEAEGWVLHARLPAAGQKHHPAASYAGGTPGANCRAACNVAVPDQITGGAGRRLGELDRFLGG